jgi:hypothetical protein
VLSSKLFANLPLSLRLVHEFYELACFMSIMRDYQHTRSSGYFGPRLERSSGSNSQIFGRTVKNEYLALGVFGTTFSAAYLATRGGSKAQTKPTTVEQAKESVPVNAASSYVCFCVVLYRGKKRC